MPVKTITIDLEAYDLLPRHKRDKQSFSQVIKEHFAPNQPTACDLLAALPSLRLRKETLDSIDAVIKKRRRSPVRVPKL